MLFLVCTWHHARYSSEQKQIKSCIHGGSVQEGKTEKEQIHMYR